MRLAEIQRETARETADRHDAIQIREGELADRRAAMKTMPMLLPFDDKKDDMDAFIRRYESYAVSLEWPKDRWAINVSALLHYMCIVGNLLTRVVIMTVSRTHCCEGLCKQKRDFGRNSAQQNQKGVSLLDML